MLAASLLVTVYAQSLVPEKEPFPSSPKYVIGHRGDAG